MRLWHQNLIPILPQNQLLGQHSECCGLRGDGWGKKHSTVDYVFEHSYELLVAYHIFVMREMKKRNINVSEEWFDYKYRGKNHEEQKEIKTVLIDYRLIGDLRVYEEHDKKYLRECINNLDEKGIGIWDENKEVFSKLADAKIDDDVYVLKNEIYNYSNLKKRYAVRHISSTDAPEITLKKYL